MKPTMLLALSFIHFALITMFPSGTVVAQDTVLDIYGNPALIGAEYYIYEPRGQYSLDRFRVIGLSAANDRVYLYDDENNGIPVIISQVNGSTMAVDTALTIKFTVSNSTETPFWKVALEPDSGGNYFLLIGGYNEGYEFKLAQNESGKSHHLYYLTYTTISPFCNATAVGIGLLDSNLVATAAEKPFQFTFVPVE